MISRQTQKVAKRREHRWQILEINSGRPNLRRIVIPCEITRCRRINYREKGNESLEHAVAKIPGKKENEKQIVKRKNRQNDLVNALPVLLQANLKTRIVEVWRVFVMTDLTEWRVTSEEI